jgi:hypothetical protein
LSFLSFLNFKFAMEASQVCLPGTAARRRDSARGLFSPSAGDGLVSGITAIRLVVEHDDETERENSHQDVFPPDSYAGSLGCAYVDKAMLRLAALCWRYASFIGCPITRPFCCRWSCLADRYMRAVPWRVTLLIGSVSHAAREGLEAFARVQYARGSICQHKCGKTAAPH